MTNDFLLLKEKKKVPTKEGFLVTCAGKQHLFSRRSSKKQDVLHMLQSITAMISYEAKPNTTVWG